MDCVDENPYQSPKSVPEVEKPPAKPPKEPRNRYVSAWSRGLGTLVGLVFLQIIIMEFVWGHTDTLPSRSERRLLAVVYALIACPVGIFIAWWTWIEFWVAFDI